MYKDESRHSGHFKEFPTTHHPPPGVRVLLFNVVLHMQLSVTASLDFKLKT